MNKRNAAFWVLALAVAAFLIWLTGRWEEAIDSYESCFMPASQAEEYAVGSKPRIFLDNDAYYWVGYAQEMTKTGKWRIRHTHFDNTPMGREVHWSQSVSWLLLITGFMSHLLTGGTMSSSVEHAAIWIGPLQYIVLTVGTGYLLFRRMGLLSALLWMFNLVTILSIQWSFHPMRPDHQGFHIGFMLASQLCLILGGLGWIQANSVDQSAPHFIRPLVPPDEKQARRLFVASGMLGGLGLWTGATVQLFGLGITAASAILLVRSLPSGISTREDDSAYKPSLWRWWAVAGASTSLLFYLIEYAPSSFSMRLEVNHPLYAFSWLCAGELLTRLSAAKMRGQPESRMLTALLFLGALLLPGLLIAGPSGWHAMHDPLMRRMHEFIDEFRPFLVTYRTSPFLGIFKNFGILPVFLVLAPWLAGKKQTTLYEWAALWMAFFTALACAVLTLWQTRWMSFFAAASLLLAFITLAVLWRRRLQMRRIAVLFYALLIAVASQTIYFGSLQFHDIPFRDLSKEKVGELIIPMLQREFSENLSRLNVHADFRLMMPPHLAARVRYYGRVPCVASYYWENLDGLHAAADFFAAEDDEQAHRIVLDRGITHVVLPPSVNLVHALYYIRNGKYSDAGAQSSLAGRMLTRPEALPSWIRRDVKLEKLLQPGFIFNGEPVLGALLVFVVQPEPVKSIPVIE